MEHPFVRHTVLMECLEYFFHEDMVTWTKKRNCSVCKISQNTSMKTWIYKPPEIIIFHLKRFEYKDQLKRKINTYVNFPLKNLDLSAFISPFHVKHQKYDLYAVVNHSGDMDDGHYTAYCKHPKTKQWNAFNDTRCYIISEATVQTSSAYLLFYTSQLFCMPRKTSS
ncbi:putative ubiquitin carboxyl-terminal hydrolase 50 [Bombina bombina]|uniref:putative ubiquitin carboxyl-terminal hydrolase 50 n=1 Tax=Bombina bombina TaxID=8345 RepID=UPI00235AB600|nr:putative ubiquitin carboxyl-terminal hydrolase 50 [Bombina bombina]